MMKRQLPNQNQRDSSIKDDSFDTLTDPSRGQISSTLLRSIYCYGYEKMSDLQQNALPEVLRRVSSSSSCLIRGGSTTGKTSCALLAAIQLFDQKFFAFSSSNNNELPPSSPSVLILCRTETRAFNVLGLLKGLGRFSFAAAQSKIQHENAQPGTTELHLSEEGQCPFTVTCFNTSIPDLTDIRNQANPKNEKKCIEFETFLSNLTANPQAFFFITTPYLLIRLLKLKDAQSETDCYPDILRNIKMVFLDKADDMLSEGSQKTNARARNTFEQSMDEILCPLAHSAQFIVTSQTRASFAHDEEDGTESEQNKPYIPKKDEFELLKYLVRDSYDNGNQDNSASALPLTTFIYNHDYHLHLKKEQQKLNQNNENVVITDNVEIGGNNWFTTMIKHYWIDVIQEDWKYDTLIDLIDYCTPKSAPEKIIENAKFVVFVSTRRKAKFIRDKLVNDSLVFSSSACVVLDKSDGDQQEEDQVDIIYNFKYDTACPVKMLILVQSVPNSVHPWILNLLVEDEYDLLSRGEENADQTLGAAENGNDGEADNDQNPSSSVRTKLPHRNLLCDLDARIRPRTYDTRKDNQAYVILHYDLPFASNYFSIIRDRFLMMKPEYKLVKEFMTCGNPQHKIMNLFFATQTDQTFGFKEVEKVIGDWIENNIPARHRKRFKSLKEHGIEELPVDFGDQFEMRWY